MPAPQSKADKPSAPAAIYHPLVIVLVAAAAGIFCDRHRPMSVEAWWTLAVGCLAAWFTIRYVWRAKHRSTPTPGIAVSILCNIALLSAVAAAAGAWHHCQWNLFATDDLGLFAQRKAEPTCVEAVAVERPRQLPPSRSKDWSADEGARLSVDLVSLRDRSEWRPVSGRATLFIQGAPPAIKTGDRLLCFAHLSAPAAPLNPSSFDHAARLRSDRTLSSLRIARPECLSVIGSGGNWFNLKGFLDRVREHGSGIFQRYLDPRQSELAAAVLLGMREEIDSERKETFLATGAVHLLAISGLHLGILAGLLFFIVRRAPIPRGWGLAAIAIVVVLYALMVDARPSVVRATVLVLIICVATYSRHYALSLNSLAFAALVVLALNPSHLFQVGPQLSFLCVAGLMWIAPQRPPFDDDDQKKVERTLKRLVWEHLGWFSRARHRIWRSAVGLAAAGAVIWVLTLPLVMARFHICTPVALILNVVIWPLMGASLVSGLGLLAAGTICPPLAYLCGYVCNLLFWLLEGSIRCAQQAPYYWFPGPENWWLWGFYGGLGLMAAFPGIRPSRRWLVGLLAGWIAVGFAASGKNHPVDRLDCTFLSVGHGCAALLELPSGKTVLYDAGRLGSPRGCVRTVSEFLWHEGRTHIDAVVISHADADHFNALPELLEKFSVGVVYVSPVMFDEPSTLLTNLLGALERHNIKVETLRAGDRLDGGEHCSIEVLHPPRRGVIGSNNANSLVLSVECFGKRLLLTGDLESSGMNALLAEQPRRCDVILAPHHGSPTGNSPEFARWCRPRWVVLSDSGVWNRSATEAVYRAVGGRVLKTSDQGAIRARFTAEGVYLSGFVDPSPPESRQRNTTISPGARNRGWRNITSNRPGNVSSISACCRSVAITYDKSWLSRKSDNSFNAPCLSPSQRVTGRPE